MEIILNDKPLFHSMKKGLHRKWKRKIIFFIIFIIILFLILTEKTGINYVSDQNIVVYGPEVEEIDKYTPLRKEMVEKQLRNRDITDEKVLAAMEKVPRHKFMTQYLGQAYEDRPIPIGYGQTISQPYIVALMTQILDIDENDKVLEIGTGSGYQAAVLAELVDKVYTIEIIKELAERVDQTIKRLGYKNIEVKNADGYFGWNEKGPFDAIIITAAANHIPLPLIEQLKDGGKLVIPLGSTTSFQTLTLITKKGNELETRFITGVRFVPMTGQAQRSK